MGAFKGMTAKKALVEYRLKYGDGQMKLYEMLEMLEDLGEEVFKEVISEEDLNRFNKWFYPVRLEGNILKVGVE